MNSYKPNEAQNGFTIIEFVIVIVVIGILAAFVMARFTGNNSFNGIAVRDQIVSMTRIAQQSSFGRSDVSLTVTPNGAGTELSLVVADTNGTFESATVEMSGLSLEADINDTTSCSSDVSTDNVTSGAPLIIAFGALGEVASSGVSGSMGAVTSALKVCVNDDVNFSVCVSPAGFAYGGDCDVD